MGMKRCESGHYYDAGKHKLCPLCAAVPMDGDKIAGAASPSVALQSAPSGAAAAGKTVAVMKKEHGIDPVVGWLIAVKGPDRGTDFRIKGEKNFIGRAPTMDICVAGDETISRENHAIVSYNPKKHGFKILPGEGRGLVYLNGEEVDAPLELKEGDKIDLGQTSLMFLPLCGPKFSWEKA